MYHHVHGLDYATGMALVTLASNERHAIEHGWLTPEVAQAIAEVRRLAWAGSEPSELLEPMMSVIDAIHAAERKAKP